jgi:hypothetical protein
MTTYGSLKTRNLNVNYQHKATYPVASGSLVEDSDLMTSLQQEHVDNYIENKGR